MASTGNEPQRAGVTAERWQQIKVLLSVALETDPAERSSYLDRACGADSSLRLEVENLLAFEHQANTTLLSCPANTDWLNESTDAANTRVGQRIGPYQLLQEIGSGGMGEVYRASRTDDQYKKEVAIKLVRSGQGSKFVIARFKSERQMLASLDHPNIARLLDGGTTDDGVPYFVMELIEGRALTQYCDQHRLSITDRLKLFLQVCSAVQYAHQRLIVHRDLKPGNILVTADGTPKLLDFGIAKILDVAAAGEYPLTLTAVRLLTPAYASPEQVEGEPITTASDVFSLGVVLYELLTGMHPFRRAESTPQEITRAVCKLEPERPSTAVRRNQAHPDLSSPFQANFPKTPSESLEKVSKILRGDLDTIILKALRKEPQRRYISVEPFAEDIRRHLNNLPVSARRDTARYRASKFVIRHKAGVAAAAIVAVVVLGGTAASLYEAHRARQNELRAERRFNDVRALANSLLFDIHDSIRDLPGATATRVLIVQRAQEYLDKLSRESQSDPVLLHELATAYSKLATVQGDGRDANLGATPAALANYQKAIALLENAVALDPGNRNTRLELAQTCLSFGRCLSHTGNNKGYMEQVRRASGIVEPLASSNPDDRETQAALGEAYSQMGFAYSSDHDLPQALIYQEKALAVYQKLTRVDPGNEKYQTELSLCHKRVAAVLGAQKQYTEALAHERTALAIDEAQLAMHPQSLRARYNITFTYNDTGLFLAEQGDFGTALNLYGKALAIRQALVEADPSDTRAKAGLSNTYNYMGLVLRKKGDFAAAIDSFEKSLLLRKELLGKDPSSDLLRTNVAESEGNLGDVYATLAFQAKSSPRDRIAYCRVSEKWYRSSLPVWRRLTADGKSAGTESDLLAKVTQAVEKCDQILGSVAQ
jgi:eukaryotic-like serine/threonine-protein kinase